MNENRHKLLRHVIDTDGKLSSECFQRVFNSGVRESWFHDYDAKANAFTDNWESVVFDFCQEYYTKWARCPSDDAVMSTMRDNPKLDAFAKRAINDILLSVRKYNAWPADTPMLVDSLRETYVGNQQTYAIQKAIKIREEVGVTAANKFALDSFARLNAVGTATTIGIKTAQQFADEVIESMKSGKEPVPIKAKYGFGKWDALAHGGVHAGEVSCLAAGASVGKSWFLLQFLKTNAVDLGKRGFIWQGEMLEHQIGVRLMCMLTGISINRLYAEFDDLEGWEQDLFNAAQKGIRELGEKVLFLDMQSCQNLAQIESAVTNHFGTQPIDFGVLDYLEKLEPSHGKNKQEADHQKVAAVSREIKTLAIRHGIGIFTASQLNRAGNRNPNADITDLSNFQVAKDVDTVIVLSNDPDDTYAPPTPGDDATPTPGTIFARFARGRTHGVQRIGTDPFRMMVEFSTGQISEKNDFANRTPVGRAFNSRNNPPPGAR